MTATDWLEQLGFLLVALFTLGTALGVILARRVLHAALWLLPALFGVAGVFALLGAHVLFALQIVVYVGAITVLILFAVMLLEDTATRDRLPRFLRYRIPPRLRPATDLVLHYSSGMQHGWAGLVAAGGACVIILAAVAEQAWYHQWRPLAPEGSTRLAGTNAQQIGEALLTRYLLPFEVASIVLLVALIGAVVVARRDPAPGPKATCEQPEDGGEGPR